MRPWIVNGLVVLITLWVAFEIAGYFAPHQWPHMFSELAPLLEKDLSDPQLGARLEHFRNESLDPITGYRNPQLAKRENIDCVGGRFTANFDLNRVRTYKGYNPLKAEILLIGDSFTYGSEVNDDETIAARLFQHTGITSANLGMPGFGSVQAYLKATSELQHFPNARVVMLGLMYEDVRRMMSSYRNAYNHYGTNLFSFQPSISKGVIKPLNLNYFASVEQFQQAARLAAENDYWAKPVHRFPYSYALYKAMTSRAFRYSYSYRIGGKSPISYMFDDLNDELLGLLFSYSQWAKQNNVTPVVVLIPDNSSLYTQSGANWLNKVRPLLPANLIVNHLDLSLIDKKTYLTTPACHPSVEGAEAIAHQYADILTRKTFLLHHFLFQSITDRSWPLPPPPFSALFSDM